MKTETTFCGDGYRLATGSSSGQVLVRMDASLAMAIGDHFSRSLPRDESIASKRFQFAAALANAGFSVLIKDSGWPADVVAFTRTHVVASSKEAEA